MGAGRISSFWGTTCLEDVDVRKMLAGQAWSLSNEYDVRINTWIKKSVGLDGVIQILNTWDGPGIDIRDYNAGFGVPTNLLDPRPP